MGVMVRPGAAVEAADGRMGTVDRVVVRPQTGELSYLIVRRGWTNELFTVPAEIVRDVAPSGTVHLAATKEQVRAQSANVPREALSANPGGREVRLPLLEEEAIPEKRLADLGELRIHKFVDTREELIREAVTRDDLLVERVPVNQPLEAPVETRVEDDWLVIPIMEEVLVVQKRLMLKEEVRIRKRQVTETQEVRESVRSERAELEDATVHGVKGLDGARAAIPPAAIPEVEPALDAVPAASHEPPGGRALAAPAPHEPPDVSRPPETTPLVPPAILAAPATAEDATGVTRVDGRRSRAMPAAPADTPQEERLASPDEITRPLAVEWQSAEPGDSSDGQPGRQAGY
jgi:uncharacterized protein (TIGR02271 family)